MRCSVQHDCNNDAIEFVRWNFTWIGKSIYDARCEIHKIHEYETHGFIICDEDGKYNQVLIGDCMARFEALLGVANELRVRLQDESAALNQELANAERAPGALEYGYGVSINLISGSLSLTREGLMVSIPNRPTLSVLQCSREIRCEVHKVLPVLLEKIIESGSKELKAVTESRSVGPV